MTRTSQAKYSPQVAKKALKGTCINAGMPHRDAVKASLSCIPVPKVSGTARRNPGRMDGVKWKGHSFICPQRVDGDLSDVESEEEEEEEEEEEIPQTRREHAIALLDIAKPAKPKGIAKDYEIVEGLRQVIFLDEEQDWETKFIPEEEWEEWDEIYESTEGLATRSRPRNGPTYSDVVQKKG